jgi:hypothetical protein
MRVTGMARWQAARMSTSVQGWKNVLVPVEDLRPLFTTRSAAKALAAAAHRAGLPAWCAIPASAVVVAWPIATRLPLT